MKNIIAIVKCLKLQLFTIFFLVITKMLYQSEMKKQDQNKVEIRHIALVALSTPGDEEL